MVSDDTFVSIVTNASASKRCRMLSRHGAVPATLRLRLLACIGQADTKVQLTLPTGWDTLASARDAKGPEWGTSSDAPSVRRGVLERGAIQRFDTPVGCARRRLPIELTAASMVNGASTGLLQVAVQTLLGSVAIASGTLVCFQLRLTSAAPLCLNPAVVVLSAANAGRPFVSFYTTKPEGMGMGPPISRCLVEAHGGRLWAKQYEPQGAVLRFTLPAEGNARSNQSGPASKLESVDV